MENFIQRSRWLCILAGFLRGIIWYTTGKLNKPGVHLLVYSVKTDEVLCVHPSTEVYLASVRNVPFICHLPGGGIDSGESAEQAIVREVCEELGVDSIDLSQAQREHIIVSFGRLRNPVTLYYLEVTEPDEFTFASPSRGGEFILSHQWRKTEIAYKFGNNGMRTALQKLNLVA